MLHMHLVTESEKYAISDWKYEGEFAIYNDIPYDDAKKAGTGFANPLNSFYSFYDGDTLVGFTNLVEEETEIFVGIGVSPTLCGRGYGREMLLETAAIAAERFPNKPLYLEVRTWNARAVKCYEHAGFRVDGTAFTQTTHIGEGEFYRMVRR